MTELLMEPVENLQQQLHYQQQPVPKPAMRHRCNNCGSCFASLRNLERHQHRRNGHCKGGEIASGVRNSFSVCDVERIPLTILASATPFFVNSFGRYQFNTNESKHSINCPFCLVHKTSMQGLTKHCLTNHRQEYMSWKASNYGKVQLRWIPPDDNLVRKVFLALKDAGLLNREIPLADSSTFVPRLKSKSTEAKGGAKKFLLPPPPPLVDCRKLTANPAAVVVESQHQSSTVATESNASLDDVAYSQQRQHRNSKRYSREASNPNYYCGQMHFNPYERQSEQFFGPAPYRHFSVYTVGRHWQSQPNSYSYEYTHSYQHQFLQPVDGQSALAPPPALQPPPRQSVYGYEYQGDRALSFCPPPPNPTQHQPLLPPHPIQQLPFSPFNPPKRSFSPSYSPLQQPFAPSNSLQPPPLSHHG